MSDLRPQPTKITIAGKEYGLLFNLNAIDEIQDKLDIPISQLSDIMSDERKVFKALKVLLAVLINEAIDDAAPDESISEKHVTPEFIGRKITVAEIPTLKGKVFSAFSDGTPQSEDDDPNPPSE